MNSPSNVSQITWIFDDINPAKLASMRVDSPEANNFARNSPFHVLVGGVVTEWLLLAKAEAEANARFGVYRLDTKPLPQGTQISIELNGVGIKEHFIVSSEVESPPALWSESPISFDDIMGSTVEGNFYLHGFIVVGNIPRELIEEEDQVAAIGHWKLICKDGKIRFCISEMTEKSRFFVMEMTKAYNWEIKFLDYEKETMRQIMHFIRSRRFGHQTLPELLRILDFMNECPGVIDGAVEELTPAITKHIRHNTVLKILRAADRVHDAKDIEQVCLVYISRFYDDLIYDVEELEDIKLRVKINKFLKNCTNVVAYPEPWP